MQRPVSSSQLLPEHRHGPHPRFEVLHAESLVGRVGIFSGQAESQKQNRGLQDALEVADDPAKGRSRELALTPGDPNALAPDRDHRSIQEVSLMLGKDGLHQRDPLPDRDIGQPDHSGMSFARGENQLSEVLVHGDDDPPFRRGPGQEGPVSRIGASLLGFKDVMALLTQPFRQAPAGAAVNQEFHLAMT